jgi:hypothetical protein
VYFIERIRLAFYILLHFSHFCLSFAAHKVKAYYSIRYINLRETSINTRYERYYVFRSFLFLSVNPHIFCFIYCVLPKNAILQLLFLYLFFSSMKPTRRDILTLITNAMHDRNSGLLYFFFVCLFFFKLFNNATSYISQNYADTRPSRYFTRRHFCALGLFNRR